MRSPLDNKITSYFDRLRKNLALEERLILKCRWQTEMWNMDYEKAVNRLADVYPFEKIVLLDQIPDVHTTPQVSEGAIANIRMRNSAEIIFSNSVKVLRGDNNFTADGEGSLIVVGQNTTIENSLVQINGKGCIVVIGDSCRIRGLKIVVRRENSMVFIGSQTTWESGAIISESGDIVAVGNDCMISNSVVIRTSDGHTIFDKATKETINNSANVLVGHHVWLGNGSRVNKGSCIGVGSVIGQCSIVSGSLDGDAVYAGAPARKIREGIVWSRTHRYEDIPERYSA